MYLPAPGLEIDRASNIPLSRQLYDKLRDVIIEERLSPHTRLPSTRELAEHLGVSRTTTVEAYQNLMAEGYIVGRAGSGHYVTEHLPEPRPAVIRTQRAGAHHAHEPLRMARRGSAILTADRESGWVSERHQVRPFLAGAPAFDDFPFHIWTRSLRRQLGSLPRNSFSYGDPAGYPPLRESIATYLRAMRGVRVDAEQVLIIDGSQEAFSLIGQCLADPGDRAWIEDPTYPGAHLAYRVQGLTVVPVPVDDQGMNVEALRVRQASAPTIIHVSPSHQYPTGAVMSLQRRLGVIDLAAAWNAWIVEDDYDSEYRFSGRPLSPLQSIDRADRVIYVGTFSKVLFPALRIGYMIVPRSLVKLFSAAKKALNRGANLLTQATIDDFIREGHFQRHLRRMRVLYGNRRLALLDAIKTDLSGLLEIKESENGLHVVGRLLSGLAAVGVAERAKRLGVVVSPISSFCLDRELPHDLLLGFAPYAERDVRAAVRKLKAAILAP